MVESRVVGAVAFGVVEGDTSLAVPGVVDGSQHCIGYHRRFRQRARWAGYGYSASYTRSLESIVRRGAVAGDVEVTGSNWG